MPYFYIIYTNISSVSDKAFNIFGRTYVQFVVVVLNCYNFTSYYLAFTYVIL